MSYAVRNDGAGWRAVNGPEDCGPDEHWQTTAPDSSSPTPAQLAAARIAEMKAALVQIDEDGARPAREIAAALASGQTPPAAAVSKVAALEASAVTLRAELAALTA